MMKYGRKIDIRTTCIMIAMFVILGLMIFRTQCEIEITDEAYYIAEAYGVLDGNIPYTYNTVLTSGFAIFLSPLVAFWRMLFPTMEGIFLFTRLMFLCFRMFCVLTIWFCLKKYYDRNKLLIALLILMPYWGMSIPNFSYNTIASWLLLIAGALTFYSFMSEKCEIQNRFAALSGILIAISVFAHPAQAPCAIWYAILWLIIGKRRKHQKAIIIYCIAGIAVTTIILSSIILLGGMHDFLYGIETILKHGTFIKPVPFSDAVKGILYSYYAEMLWIGAWYLFFLIIHLILKKKKKDSELPQLLRCGLVLGTIFSFIYILCQKEGAEIFWHLGFVGMLDSILISTTKKKEKNRWLMYCFVVPLFFFMAINGFMTYCDVSKRMYIFIPTFLSIVLILYDENSNKKRITDGMVAILACFAVLLLVKTDMQYIYRGYPIDRLDSKIESGIYQGIYTIKDKQEAIIELEDYIKKVTSKDETVLFMEVVPMAYLMSEGHVYCPTTWDIMQYSYGNNNAEGMLRYFESRGGIPDKIMYIDTGRDEMLSIDKDGYEFNEFVNKNYYCQERKQIGNRFKTVLYIKKR